MILAISLGVQTPDLILLRHPAMQTDNIGDRRGGGVATRIADQYRIWRTTFSDIKTAPTHGEIKTISEKLAYQKFIKDSEFELENYLSGKISSAKILGILRLN